MAVLIIITFLPYYMARAFSTTLDRSGEAGIYVLLLILGGKYSVFHYYL